MFNLFEFTNRFGADADRRRVCCLELGKGGFQILQPFKQFVIDGIGDFLGNFLHSKDNRDN